MTTLLHSGDLEGRKSVRLRRRQNLHIQPQARGLETCYVVKDPITLRYFHLDERQRFLLQLMDGQHSLADIQQAYENRFRPRRLPLDELEGFARELLESGLVQNESPGTGVLMIQRARKQYRQWLFSLLNLFCIKIPLANPDRFLSRCNRVGQVVFSLGFLALSGALFLGALSLLATHWQDFLNRLPNYRDFLSVQNLFYLWLMLGLVKVFHELGHAFCCKRMGAEVQEIGVLVLFFFPTLYCNVSDSWTLSSKWRRMAVAAAGIYVELVIASLATYLWWCSDAASILHHLSFAVMCVCSITTLLGNANPLMRFDGYFILSDFLEAPNLAQRATQCLQSAALQWLGAAVRKVEATGHARPRFLFWFGLASLIYRWYVLALTLYFLSEFLHRYDLPGLGILLALVGAAILLGGPVVQVLRWLNEQGRIPEMQPLRLGLTGGVGLALVAGFFLIPFPVKVRGVALIQIVPEQTRRVIVPEVEGFLQELRVRDGQRVHAGEVLAILTNPRLDIKRKLNEADQALRHQQRNAFAAQLAESGPEHDAIAAHWQQCDLELKALVQQHRTLLEQHGRLVLRAPVDGIILGLPSIEDRGKWIEKGTEFCRIGNDQALRALVLVDPADHWQIHPGSAATIRIHGNGSRQLPGVVTHLASLEAQHIPPQLSSKAGGEIATLQDPTTKTERPHAQHYLVSVHLKAVDARTHPGVLGRVKIDTASRTLWWRTRQYLGTTLNWGL